MYFCSLLFFALTTFLSFNLSAAECLDKHSCTIRINEVSPNFGTGTGSAKHDFVELYNPSNSIISLEGLSISYKARSVSSGFKVVAKLQGSIAPNGYFLIAESDFEHDTGINPDLTTSLNFSYYGGSIFLHSSSSLVYESYECPNHDTYIIDQVAFIRKGQSSYLVCAKGDPVEIDGLYKYSFERTGSGDENDIEDFIVKDSDGTPSNSQETGIEQILLPPPPPAKPIFVYSGPRDDDLLYELYEKVKDHKYMSYNSARDKIYKYIAVFNRKIECIYTGKTLTGPIDKTDAYYKGFSTEHSWPKSQFNYSKQGVSDLHHLFPIQNILNSNRGTLDFSEVGKIKKSFCYDGSCSYTGWDSSDDFIFEVRDERKGDVARAHFYMVARYRFTSVPIDDSNKSYTRNCKDSDRCINDIEEAILREWHKNDPVDQREIERNNRIESVQGNRNPFVDKPEYVDYIDNF